MNRCPVSAMRRPGNDLAEATAIAHSAPTHLGGGRPLTVYEWPAK